MIKNKIPPQMSLFIENLLEAAGLSFTSQSAKNTAVEEIYSKLDEYLGVVVEEKLSDDQLIEYFNLLTSDVEQEQIQEFLAKSIPNFSEVLAQAMLEFREVYLSSIT